VEKDCRLWYICDWGNVSGAFCAAYLENDMTLSRSLLTKFLPAVSRVVIASIIRLVLLVIFYFKTSTDITNNLLLPWFMTLAEIGVGIVGACLPCLMVGTYPFLSLFL
jgi:hypothetical protein